jgi:hypothetical protein
MLLTEQQTGKTELMGEFAECPIPPCLASLAKAKEPSIPSRQWRLVKVQ